MITLIVLGGALLFLVLLVLACIEFKRNKARNIPTFGDIFFLAMYERTKHKAALYQYKTKNLHETLKNYEESK